VCSDPLGRGRHQGHRRAGQPTRQSDALALGAVIAVADQMVVFDKSIWDRLDACSNAILALILCDRPGFAAMATAILEQQAPATRERLRAELEELVSPAVRMVMIMRITMMTMVVRIG
jgi:hypothetical protein